MKFPLRKKTQFDIGTNIAGLIIRTLSLPSQAIVDFEFNPKSN
jgi:hypothetical protein